MLLRRVANHLTSAASSLRACSSRSGAHCLTPRKETQRMSSNRHKRQAPISDLSRRDFLNTAAGGVAIAGGAATLAPPTAPAAEPAVGAPATANVTLRINGKKHD